MMGIRHLPRNQRKTLAWLSYMRTDDGVFEKLLQSIGKCRTLRCKAYRFANSIRGFLRSVKTWLRAMADFSRIAASIHTYDSYSLAVLCEWQLRRMIHDWKSGNAADVIVGADRDIMEMKRAADAMHIATKPLQDEIWQNDRAAWQWAFREVSRRGLRWWW